VKDRVFSGPDVEEALASAAASLGLPMAELRYVVLDPGGSGSRGLKATPARIAVLLQERPADGGPQRRPAAAPRGPVEPGPVDLRSSLRAVVRALAEAGDLRLECDVEQTAEALVLQIRGEDAAFFHGEDGKGEPLHALEHLLQRAHAAALHPLFLRVRCEGYRERRDEALAEEARRVAEAVRADGEPRELEPRNAYERRIVHVALQDEPGVRTFSVGEGLDRRVTIALAAARPEEPAGGGADGR
jgi:spoIIIJ-associated protein